MDRLRSNQTDSARVYYEKGLECLLQLSDTEKAGVYHNLGAFYLNYVASKDSLATSFLQKAIRLGDTSEKLRSYAVLAAHYAASGQDDRADTLWAQSMNTKDDYVRAFILLLVILLCLYQRRKWMDERRFNQQLAQSEAHIQDIKTEFHLFNQENRETFDQETQRSFSYR